MHTEKTAKLLKHQFDIPPQTFSSNDWKNITQQTRRITDLSSYFNNAEPIRTKVEKRSETKFCTGSKYSGEWNPFGMCGKGVYTFSNDIYYEGLLREGRFHGEGVLHFPNGNKIEGIWFKGEAKKSNFIFSDGLKFSEKKWNYCQYPDRRFYTCIKNGIPAVGESYMTASKILHEVPNDCYDTEEGIYNPKTKTLVNRFTNKIIRIPTRSEEIWIIRHCRKGGLKEIPEHRLPVIMESILDVEFDVYDTPKSTPPKFDVIY